MKPDEVDARFVEAENTWPANAIDQRRMIHHQQKAHQRETKESPIKESPKESPEMLENQSLNKSQLEIYPIAMELKEDS